VQSARLLLPALAAHVDATLARGARDNATLALAMVDIDAFGDVNDSLGHAHGDDLAIIRLGASLGLSLTAEGVETLEQADRLRALGQGYMLARPLAVDDATELLRQRPADVTGGAALDTVD